MGLLGSAWFAMVFIGVVSVWAMFPDQTFHTLFHSHFADQTQRALSINPGYSFRFNSLLAEWPVLIPAFGGLISIAAQCRVMQLFPVLLLATSLVVHALHRPYWPYYTLHFAIPCCLLTGIMIERGWQWLWQLCRRGSPDSYIKWVFGIGVWSLLLAMTGTYVVEQLHAGWNSIRRVALISEDPIVQELRQESDQNCWVFTFPSIYAFHAKRLMPPELAILAQKRFWSEEITFHEIEQLLSRYVPETIYIDNSALKKELAGFLKTNYRSGENSGIFIRSDAH